jgi:choline dehydrogenase
LGTRRDFVKSAAVLAGAASVWSCGGRVREPDAGEFDFIIVGAGSSGCVLASRLSARADVRVLVVEAGGPETDPAIARPGQWTTLIGGALDWGYRTEPEPGLDGRTIAWPRGRSIGGSSTINAMSYVRGHRLCFDRWAERADESWSYRALLPYFRSLEDNSHQPSEYIGSDGPLAVSDQTDPHAGHLAFLEAARIRGFAADPLWEFNNPEHEGGAGFYQKNIKDGRRHSAAAAFLTPVLDRPNLSVWSWTRMRRLLVSGRRVEGIECLRDGAVVQARATRGVVLAAGAIESPKILMLSGIGPADALARHGIPVVADAPDVGSNLHDRPRVAVRWAGTTVLPPSSVSAGLFARSAGGTATEPPDIQFYVGRGVDVPDEAITLTVAVGMPKSRGSIALRSSDPDIAPVIRAGYFEDARDMDVMIEGIQLARALGESRAYDGLRGEMLLPAPGEVSSDALRAFVRRTADTIFHPVGTCRMGADARSVVDSSLRVRGVDGLWIADASIIPELVNAQTHAACLMIGARAAAILLQRA